MGRRGNGEGSITKRKDGLYMARYWVEILTGKKRKTVYAKTRREIDEKLTRAKADRAQGLIFEGDREILSTYLEQWLDDVVRDTVKENMLDNYTYLVLQ